MSLPRRVIPGATYLLTRRCARRMFLLVPSAETNRVFGYCLAVAAERFGVIIHGYVVMSNHWHAVVTDPHGRISEFMQLVHALVARCMNRMLGTRENFWSSDKPSVVLLAEAEDVLSKLVYVTVSLYPLRISRGNQWELVWLGLRSRPPSAAIGDGLDDSFDGQVGWRDLPWSTFDDLASRNDAVF